MYYVLSRTVLGNGKFGKTMILSKHRTKPAANEAATDVRHKDVNRSASLPSRQVWVESKKEYEK